MTGRLLHGLEVAVVDLRPVPIKVDLEAEQQISFAAESDL